MKWVVTIVAIFFVRKLYHHLLQHWCWKDEILESRVYRTNLNCVRHIVGLKWIYNMTTAFQCSPGAFNSTHSDEIHTWIPFEQGYVGRRCLWSTARASVVFPNMRPISLPLFFFFSSIEFRQRFWETKSTTQIRAMRFFSQRWIHSFSPYFRISYVKWQWQEQNWRLMKDISINLQRYIDT